MLDGKNDIVSGEVDIAGVCGGVGLFVVFFLQCRPVNQLYLAEIFVGLGRKFSGIFLCSGGCSVGDFVLSRPVSL